MDQNEIFQYAHSNWIIDAITKSKVRFTRGQFWMYFIKDILLFGLGFSVFASTLKNVTLFGVNLGFLEQYTLWMYVLGPVVYLVGGYVSGYADERIGIWKAENAYSTCVLNPEGIGWMMSLIRGVVREELDGRNDE